MLLTCPDGIENTLRGSVVGLLGVTIELFGRFDLFEEIDHLSKCVLERIKALTIGFSTPRLGRSKEDNVQELFCYVNRLVSGAGSEAACLPELKHETEESLARFWKWQQGMLLLQLSKPAMREDISRSKVNVAF